MGRAISRTCIYLASCLIVLLSVSTAGAQCGDVDFIFRYPGPSIGISIDADGDLLVVQGGGGALLYRRSATGWFEETRLLPSDGAAGDSFGSAIAIDGDLVVIGAPNHDEIGLDAGAVYIFQYDGANWVQEAKLLASNGLPDDKFGSALAVNGNTVVVGVAGRDDLAPDAGAAYVFSFDGIIWSEQAKLFASDGEENDRFGGSVAIDSGSVIIGASGDDDLGAGSGAVYVFEYDGVDWIEQQKIYANDGGAGMAFGARVVADAGRLFIMGGTIESGYVFGFDGVEWVQEAKLNAPPDAASFGIVMDADLGGDIIAVGSFRGERVEVFRNDAGVWNHLETIVPYGSNLLWFFGVAVSDSYVGVSNLFNRSFHIYNGIGEADCNRNRQGDTCEIAIGNAFDCNGNGIPDDCENDCNGNGLDDACDLDDGTSLDCNANGIPDECENDCNGNGLDDACDLDAGTSFDCNFNGILDECDIAAGRSFDCDADAILDECQIDCNENGIGDACDIAGGTSIDTNFNDVPDECERPSCPPEFKVIASDGRPGDRFGESVAIDGDVAIVGVYLDDDLAEDAGAAYIFRRSGETWFKEAKLLASDGEADAWFGMSVSISGAPGNEVALIGAGWHGPLDVRPGQAYLFRFDPVTGQWNEEMILHPPTAWETGRYLFGYYVTILDDVAIVGSGRQTPEGESSVVAYVYRYDPALSTWNEEAILPMSRIPYVWLWSPTNPLSFSGDVIVAGEPGEWPLPPLLPGTVFVYRYDPASSAWIEENFLTVSQPGLHDAYGIATAVDGDVMVVGASYTDDNGADSGAAYVYRFNPGAGVWMEEAKLHASDGAEGDYFGISVAVEGDVILVGAWGADGNSVDSGIIYRFRFDPATTNWVEEGTIKSIFGGEGDRFGWDLALSNGVVVVGANSDDNFVPDSGAAYFYDGIMTACPAIGDFDGDGVVGVTDLLDLLIAWGDCPLPCPPDMDGDGVVGVTDLLILLMNWD